MSKASIWCALAWASAMFASSAVAGVCPDVVSRVCLNRIRTLVDALSYVEARDEAELQCQTPSPESAGAIGAPALAAIASGCHYLFLLERFLGHGPSALEAREKARRIATFGCGYGHMELCELQVALLDDAWSELLIDVGAELRAAKMGGALTSIDVSRELGSRVKTRVEDGLKKALAQASPAPGRRVSARLDTTGGGVSLRLWIVDAASTRVVWDKTFTSRDVAARQRLFGFDVVVPEEVLRVRLRQESRPTYKVMAGLGVARLPNVSGSAVDHERITLNLRSSERIGSGHSEFGAMVTAHVTRRSLLKKTDRPGRSAAETPPTDGVGEDAVKPVSPYAGAFGFAFIYNLMFFRGEETYDGVRPSVNVAAGLLSSGLFTTPMARIGFDLFIGRSFVLSIGGFRTMKTTMLNTTGAEDLKVPAASGGEFLFSYNL